MATKFPASSTFTITVLEADGSSNIYSASKKMGETTIYLMQGTVNVIKATLVKE